MHQSHSRVILIADNWRDTADLIATVLQLHGFGTKTVHSAIGVLTNLHEFSPDLILLNVRLPGMNGYALTQYLRQSKLCVSCPIVLYSTTTQYLVDDGKKQGSNGIIRNITNFENLVEEVEKILSLHAPTNQVTPQIQKTPQSIENPTQCHRTPLRWSGRVTRNCARLQHRKPNVGT